MAGRRSRPAARDHTRARRGDERARARRDRALARGRRRRVGRPRPARKRDHVASLGGRDDQIAVPDSGDRRSRTRRQVRARARTRRQARGDTQDSCRWGRRSSSRVATRRRGRRSQRRARSPVRAVLPRPRSESSYLALIELDAGDVASSERLARDALELAVENGHSSDVTAANPHLALGRALMRGPDLHAAIDHLERAVELSCATGLAVLARPCAAAPRCRPPSARRRRGCGHRARARSRGDGATSRTWECSAIC